MRRIVITGASRGLGRALARRLTGDRLALVARSEPDLREVAAETGGIAIPGDQGDIEGLDGLAARISEALGGPPDVVVLNASTLGAVPMPALLDTSWQLFVGRLDGTPVATAGAYVGERTTLVAFVFGHNAPSLTLFPTRYFYPYPWDGTFDPSCVTPETYAIHHWEGSWTEKKPPAKGVSGPKPANIWRLRLAKRLPRLGMLLQRRAFIRAREAALASEGRA